MWFGDLVTMRWWDDLWLNESFAEWASALVQRPAPPGSPTRGRRSCRSARTGATGRTSSPPPTRSTARCPTSRRSRSTSTASRTPRAPACIKQLVAYVGIGAVPGRAAGVLRQARLGQRHLRRPALRAGGRRPAGSCASSPRSGWRPRRSTRCAPRSTIGAGRRVRARSRCARRRRPGYPTLRTHRIGVGLYDLTDGRLVRRERLEVDVTGEQTERRRAGRRTPAADVLLLNDDDLTYAKLRLDERSMATVVQHIAGFESSLARALCWAAAWDMVRDAELAARDYVALVLRRPARRDRHQPGHRHPAAGASHARPCTPTRRGRRPAGPSSPTDREGGAGRGRAGQRLPARLGARVRLRGPLARRTWRSCAAGSTASTCPPG